MKHLNKAISLLLAFIISLLLTPSFAAVNESDESSSDIITSVAIVSQNRNSLRRIGSAPNTYSYLKVKIHQDDLNKTSSSSQRNRIIILSFQKFREIFDNGNFSNMLKEVFDF